MIVRGEDQLMSFKDTLADYVNDTISGADGYIESGPVPSGEVWKVTQAVAHDNTTGPSTIEFRASIDGAFYRFGGQVKAFAAGECLYWPCELYLGPDDYVRVYFTGGVANDTCRIWLTGHKMTLEE